MALRAVAESPRSSPQVRPLIDGTANAVASGAMTISALTIGALTIGAIAIERALRRPRRSRNSPRPAASCCRSRRSVRAAEDLTLLHADPFERLRVAQALAEPFHLVTQDQRLAGCGSTVIAV